MAVEVANLTSKLSLDTRQYSAALTRAETNATKFSKNVIDENKKLATSYRSVAESMEAIGNKAIPELKLGTYLKDITKISEGFQTVSSEANKAHEQITRLSSAPMKALDTKELVEALKLTSKSLAQVENDAHGTGLTIADAFLAGKEGVELLSDSLRTTYKGMGHVGTRANKSGLLAADSFLASKEAVELLVDELRQLYKGLGFVETKATQSRAVISESFNGITQTVKSSTQEMRTTYKGLTHLESRSKKTGDSIVEDFTAVLGTFKTLNQEIRTTHKRLDALKDQAPATSIGKAFTSTDMQINKANKDLLTTASTLDKVEKKAKKVELPTVAEQKVSKILPEKKDKALPIVTDMTTSIEQMVSPATKVVEAFKHTREAAAETKKEVSSISSELQRPVADLATIQRNLAKMQPILQQGIKEGYGNIIGTPDAAAFRKQHEGDTKTVQREMKAFVDKGIPNFNKASELLNLSLEDSKNAPEILRLMGAEDVKGQLARTRAQAKKYEKEIQSRPEYKERQEATLLKANNIRKFGEEAVAKILNDKTLAPTLRKKRAQATAERYSAGAQRIENQPALQAKMEANTYRMANLVNENFLKPLGKGITFGKTDYTAQTLSKGNQEQMAKRVIEQQTKAQKGLQQESEKLIATQNKAIIQLQRLQEAYKIQGIRDIRVPGGAAQAKAPQLSQMLQRLPESYKLLGQRPVMAQTPKITQLPAGMTPLGRRAATDPQLQATGVAAETSTPKVNKLVQALDRLRMGYETLEGAHKRFIGQNLQAGQSVDKLAAQAKKAQRPVANIFKGIVLAQTFYAGVGAIRDTITGMWGLSQATEVARSSFGLLLKDMDQAKQLTAHVQDFAIASSFTFETAASASQQLLAYGFELENIGFMLNTVGDAAAAMGNQEAFGSIVKALGQIQTRGKLATQEILQLTEAGIPAYTILGEKLGLTGDQLSKIGKMGIKSDVAIQALTAGMVEKFGGAMQAISQTFPGMMSNVKEMISTVGSEFMDTMYKNAKEGLGKISATLNEWITTMRTGGIGSLFEQIIPPEFHQSIRMLLANLEMVWRAFIDMHIAIMPFNTALVNVGLSFANLILPVLTVALNTFAYLANVLTTNTPLVHIFTGALTGLMILKTIAMVSRLASDGLAGLAVIKGLIMPFQAGTMAASMLTIAFTWLKTALTGGFGIPTAIATVTALGTSLMATGAIVSKVTGNLGKATGAVSDKYLQPVFKEGSETVQDFGKSIGESAENVDDLGNATKKAGDKAKKAAQNLMSFDEVFTLPDEMDEADTGGGGVPDFEMPGMGDIPMPSMPDFSAFVQEYTKNFENAMEIGFKPKTKWKALWEDVKSGFALGVEVLGGAFGYLGHIGTTIYEILKAGVKSIITIFDGDATTLKGIWKEAGARINVSWAKVMSDLKGETAKAMKILNNSTGNGMQGITETFEYALKTLPSITKDNMGEAAATFTSMLRVLDEDGLTVLRGTSKTMAQLFAGIRTDMSKDEAMKTFTQNLQIMSDAGSLEMNTVQKDIEAAMKKIKESIQTEIGQAQKSSNELLGTMAENMRKSSDSMATSLIKDMQHMSGTTINTLVGMEGSWGEVFRGITADSDLNSKETKRLVTANIERMKADGTWNITEMSRLTQEQFTKMSEEADARTEELARSVNTGTLEAAKFAGINATLINDNINQALKTIPDQSEATLKKAKEKMVDQLVAAGALTREQGDQIVRGLMGTVNTVPGKMETVFGVDIKAAITKAKPHIVSAMLDFGSAIGQGFLDGIWNKLKDTVFNWRWYWNNLQNAVDSALNSGLLGIFDKLNPFKKKGKGRSMDIDSGGAIRSVMSAGTPIPQFAKGGIVRKDTLARIGEGNRKEAVVPLENKETMELLGSTIGGYVSEALAGGMQMQLKMNKATPTPPGTQSATSQTNMVVFAMDDNNVRTLLRRLRLEAEREKTRTFGTVKGFI